MSEKPRLSRLTEIVMHLQSKKLTTASFLAEKYQVSVRTIYRDIRTLENSGIPIVVHEGKGYSLIDGYHVPPVMFTENEANALVTAEQIISKNKDASLVENYRNAVTRIKAVLKNTQKEKAELLSERIYFRENITRETTSHSLMTIQSAITDYTVLEIEYRSMNNQKTNRAVEPFAIFSTRGNWLLIAYCQLRKGFRIFRIDHIQKLIERNQTFKPHDMTLKEYFSQWTEQTNNP